MLGGVNLPIEEHLADVGVIREESPQGELVEPAAPMRLSLLRDPFLQSPVAAGQLLHGPDDGAGLEEQTEDLPDALSLRLVDGQLAGLLGPIEAQHKLAADEASTPTSRPRSVLR